jgi:hypothetical protein
MDLEKHKVPTGPKGEKRPADAEALIRDRGPRSYGEAREPRAWLKQKDRLAAVPPTSKLPLTIRRSRRPCATSDSPQSPGLRSREASSPRWTVQESWAEATT